MNIWLVQRIHSSWLIACGSAGFVAGVASALYASLPMWLVVAEVVVIGVSGWVGRRYTLPFLIVGCVCIGNGWGSEYKGKADIITPLYGQQIILCGSITEDPVIDEKGIVKFQLNKLVVGGNHMSGAVWVSATTKQSLLRGDEVRLEGILNEGFGVFVGSMYRAHIDEVIRPSPGDMGRVVRDWFAAAVRLGIPEPQASLGIGFLTGQKSALPEDLSEALRIAGLSHIVVASGYNLTVLVRLARRAFVKVSRYAAAVTSGLMIMAFVAITGLSPSMTRAGLVSGLSLVTWYYGRAFHPFVLLPFAAAVTVLWQPSYAWGDLGWLLSFTAFGGVMIVAPLLQAYFFGESPPGVLRQILGETIAAHIVTLPIVVMSFGTVSHVAIIANLMIVPLVPLAMLLTFIVGVIGLAVPALVEWVAMPVTWLLGYMTSVATFLAELPWAQSEISIEAWGIGIYLLLLILACWHMWRVTRVPLREVNIVS